LVKINRIVSPEVGEPPAETWSNCLVVGNQIFIAGMTARSAEFDIVSDGAEYEQARAIFAKIENLMTAAGGSMADVVKVNIFVTDIAKRKEVWRARREFFTGNFPVSTLVEVSALALPEMVVEVEAVGFIGDGTAN
jgi:2-iminobutanoate/2-iminopropanoate deaminase